ncbi:hypothetical protein PR003_g7095 [Phytophthora rubi]|uniref:Uncharacterized protein n=1 Tax=Phytophthora rubi TaxID=129364 RepID=A0A6A3NUB4_9STRA|nr:hypothetical protein PR002_g2434 [Phytophthora rubi]KAE9347090.1 hypothetical protein PR003_g7095 [Phytophthora rubi]
MGEATRWEVQTHHCHVLGTDYAFEAENAAAASSVSASENAQAILNCVQLQVSSLGPRLGKPSPPRSPLRGDHERE